MASTTAIGRTTITGGVSGTASFDDVDIGSASASRKVIVVWFGIQNGLNSFTPSCTINGNAATLDLASTAGGDDGNGNQARGAIFSLVVPTGTTADIVITFTGAAFFDATIDVKTTNAGSVIDTASTDTGGGEIFGTLNLNVDTEDDGLVVAGVLAYNLSSPAVAWTGATEDEDGSLYGNDVRSSSHADVSTGATPRTVNAVVTVVTDFRQSFGLAVSYAAPPEGTTYEQSCGGTVTPTSTVKKQTSKHFAGAVAPSATVTIALVLHRSLAGAVTPAGSLAKRTAKHFAGSVASAGAITKQTAKRLVGGLAPTSSLTKLTSKHIAGNVTPTGATLPGVVYKKSVAGVVAIAGALLTALNPIIAVAARFLRRFGFGFGPS